MTARACGVARTLPTTMGGPDVVLRSISAAMCDATLYAIRMPGAAFPRWGPSRGDWSLNKCVVTRNVSGEKPHAIGGRGDPFGRELERAQRGGEASQLPLGGDSSGRNSRSQ